MKKRLIKIIITSLLLTTSACVAGDLTAPAPTATVPPPTAAAPIATATPAVTGGGIYNKNIIEDSPSPRYTIKIQYPYLLADGKADAFNQDVDGKVQAMTAEIKKNAADSEEWRLQNLSDAYSTLTVNYSLPYAAQDVYSVSMVVEIYYAGAAHPMNYVLPVNFNLRTGKVLTLADLFKPGSDYLKIISDYCTQQLTEQHKDVFIFPEGALPTEENYQTWTMRYDGLLVTFNPYQVTPYAAGRIDVLVPYYLLKPIFADDSPLQRVYPY